MNRLTMPAIPEKIRKYVQRIMLRHIFVRADLFRELIKLNIAIPEEKLKRGRIRYSIWTAQTYEVPIKQESIYVTREVSKAIRVLTGGYGQMFSYPNLEPSYKNGILMVMGIPVTINTAIARGDICNAIVNADGYNLPFDELWTNIGNRDIKSAKEHFMYFYPKVRYLNQYIKDKLGFENYLFINDGKVGINPLYIPEK